MYCLVDWEQTPDGKQPALPEDTGFLLLAEPFPQTDYGLFKVDVTQDQATSLHIEPVPGYVACLLDSAKCYPPALALARNEVEQMRSPSRTTFVDALAERLQYYLEGQRSSPFFLAQAK
jgi:hypothetical protein